MRVLIVRHGDPYYPTDSLTEKGQREAELLGERLAKENITHAYVSPLGRAKMTAAPTLSRIGMEATELEWLREFPAFLEEEFAYKIRMFERKVRCPWNMPPQIWADVPGIYDSEGWRDAPFYRDGRVQARYDLVCRGWDDLLAEHGYTREGSVYRIADGWEEKHETIALFCHLGLGNALLSHIMHLSLTAIWHTLFLPTTSVTTVFMERHVDEIPYAHARLISVGDTSHLYAGGEPMSTSGLLTDSIL